ncbi:hypothetical protein DOY81_006324 [Sarcophaga bullata]|nr:hypothetical protein DOY81_006324 [Sarcophaga bullata]
MRGFIIFLCFAFSQAEKLGYNYGSAGSHNAFDSRFRNRGNSISATQSYSRTSANDVSRISGIKSRVDNGSHGFSNGILLSAIVESPVEANYNKEFFSYSAPEEDFNDVEAVERLAAEMRKNLRVIFIKAPENTALTNAALQLAKQTAESKTAIYVLTKQTDVSDLSTQLQKIQQTVQSKPEVHFVKYRTPEDAIRAQQLIQREYDTLGGTSRVSNDVVSPILDFSSKRDNRILSGNTSNNVASFDDVAKAINAYLPARTRN